MRLGISRYPIGVTRFQGRAVSDVSAFKLDPTVRYQSLTLVLYSI